MPKPWSEDWVFQTTYFCNVHREDDKVTRWIRKNYTPESFGTVYELAIVAARIFNRPETLDEISVQLHHRDWSSLAAKLTLMQMHKEQIWSGAYLISTCGAKMSKIEYCVELLQEANEVLPMYDILTCTEAHWMLMQINGIGSFLAAQIVADLKNTGGHPLRAALDWQSFSAPGPGSLRGLSWFHERKITSSTYDDAIEDVKHQISWKGDMQNLQNCMCEYDKYCRVLTGTGRSKRGYDAK